MRCQWWLTAAAVTTRTDIRPLASAADTTNVPPLTPTDAYAQHHAFSDAANWLVPGKVLLGANPNKGRGSAVDRLCAIRAAGVDTFVSLQELLEERDAGYIDEASAVAEPEPTFLRHEIPDLRPAPSLEWLSVRLVDLVERVRRGETLYIHCYAGRGRTGLVAACLLGHLYAGLTADEALERVGAYYRLRASFGVAASRALDGMSPETEPQRQQVRDYYAAHLS